MLITALHPFAEGESKSRECKNEEMCPLALLAPASVPAAPPPLQSVLGLGGLSEDKGRKALLHLTPKRIPPPISENQNHETGVCLT